MPQEILEIADKIRIDGKVDVVKLARELNISVKPINNITEIATSAYIQKDDGSFSIYVNGNQSKQRQRFSIAHEIAHFFLHNHELQARGILHRASMQQLSLKKEKQADDLAATILMPDKDIETQLKFMNVSKQTKINIKSVETLCNRYDVSLYAMIVKLRDLNYYVPFINVYE